MQSDPSMIRVSYVVSISLSHPKSTHCAENSVQKQFSGQLYETLIQNSKKKSLNMVKTCKICRKLKKCEVGSDLWIPESVTKAKIPSYSILVTEKQVPSAKLQPSYSRFQTPGSKSVLKLCIQGPGSKSMLQTPCSSARFEICVTNPLFKCQVPNLCYSISTRLQLHVTSL